MKPIKFPETRGSFTRIFTSQVDCGKCVSQFFGNKAKERISKRVFQENKARQIFRKTNISYPQIRTRPHIEASQLICYAKQTNDRASNVLIK